MSRKPKKGYFVKGHFVAEGSELDIQLKAELKGTPDASRTDLKRESDELQDLGKELLTLRADLFDAVGLPDKLADALAEARRITNFEGKRRLIADDDTLAAWMAEHPTTDTQQLRALIRQARKDAQPAGKEANVQVSQGLAPRKGRAYRELFQLVREHLGGTGMADASDTNEDNSDE
jgi:ribosome-associated protein